MIWTKERIDKLLHHDEHRLGRLHQLIARAEAAEARVRELEKQGQSPEEYYKCVDTIRGLDKENARLREALKEISDIGCHHCSGYAMEALGEPVAPQEKK